MLQLLSKVTGKLKDLSLWVLSVFTIAGVGAAPFIAPTNLAAGDIGVLRASITASQTTMTLEPVKKWVDGAQVTGCFDTGSGVVLIEDQIGRKEWSAYESKSCSAANVTTLSGLTRGLNPTSPTITAGTGLGFDAGAKVRVINWPGYFNDGLYRNIQKTMVGSGRITSDQTTLTWINATSVTTGERDGFKVVADGDIIYNETLGSMQYRAAGSWVSFGSGGDVNATLTTAGKVQIASTGAILAATATGSTGAFNVLSAQYTTTSGGLLNGTQAGYIPVIENSGFLSGTLLGQGPTALTFLRGDLTWATPTAGSGTNVVAQDTATNPSVNSATYTALDSTNLSEQRTVSSGASILFNFTGSCEDTGGGAANSTFEMNIQKDGTEIESSSGGMLRVTTRNAQGDITRLVNSSFSYLYTERSSGTFTYRPSMKTSSALTVTCDDSVHFQALVLE